MDTAARECTPNEASVGSVDNPRRTWGTGLRSHYILVKLHRIMITEALYMALVYLRSPCDAVTLWIDQLSINQDDDNEKNIQVSLMHQIYSRASQVVVWLGPAGHRSDRLMHSFHTVGQRAYDWGLQEYITKERFAEYQAIVNKLNPSDRVTQEFQALCIRNGPLFDLKDLCSRYQRPWFKRLWTVQEMYVATDAVVVCGTKQVNLEYIWLALVVLDFFLPENTPREKLRDIHRVISYNPLVRLLSSRRRRQGVDRTESTGETLHQLLVKFHQQASLETFDDRDRIFALLALAADAPDLGILPDYTKRTTPESVYIDAANSIIRAGGLDLLAAAQFPKAEKLTSWVPDWRAVIHPSFKPAVGVTGDVPRFSASKQTQMSLIELQDNQLLGFEGFFVDEIEEVGSPWEPHDTIFNDAPLATLLSQIRVMCQNSRAKGHSIYTSDTRRDEAVWRVPVPSFPGGKNTETDISGR